MKSTDYQQLDPTKFEMVIDLYYHDGRHAGVCNHEDELYYYHITDFEDIKADKDLGYLFYTLHELSEEQKEFYLDEHHKLTVKSLEFDMLKTMVERDVFDWEIDRNKEKAMDAAVKLNKIIGWIVW